MGTELIAFFAAVAGALLTMLGNFFTAKFTSGTTNIINVREMLSKQICNLEDDLKDTKKELAKLRLENFVWTRRYWALYRYHIVKAPTKKPPAFHAMEDEEVEEMIADIYSEHNPNQNEA